MYVLYVPIFIWAQGFSTALGMSAYRLQTDMSLDNIYIHIYFYIYTKYTPVLLMIIAYLVEINSYLRKTGYAFMWLASCRLLQFVQFVLKTVGVRIHKRNNK